MYRIGHLPLWKEYIFSRFYYGLFNERVVMTTKWGRMLVCIGLQIKVVCLDHCRCRTLFIHGLRWLVGGFWPDWLHTGRFGAANEQQFRFQYQANLSKRSQIRTSFLGMLSFWYGVDNSLLLVWVSWGWSFSTCQLYHTILALIYLGDCPHFTLIVFFFTKTHSFLLVFPIVQYYALHIS